MDANSPKSTIGRFFGNSFSEHGFVKIRILILLIAVLYILDGKSTFFIGVNAKYMAMACYLDVHIGAKRLG